MIQAGRLQLVRCNHAGNLRGSARPDRPTRPVNVPQVRCNHIAIRCPPTDFGRGSLGYQSRGTPLSGH